MSTFNAASSVEPMEYDFSKYSDRPDAVGTVPEPSTAQMNAYMDEVREMGKGISGLQERMKALQAKQSAIEASDAIDDAELNVLLDEIEKIDINEYTGKMVGIVARLCSQQPSEETLAALPHRVQQAFFKWIGTQLNPERVAAASN